MMPELDLHGVKHEDVRKKCDKFMAQMWGRHEWANIVTGHSPEMQRLVIEALEDYDVEANVSITNSAVIRIHF